MQELCSYLRHSHPMAITFVIRKIGLDYSTTLVTEFMSAVGRTQTDHLSISLVFLYWYWFSSVSLLPTYCCYFKFQIQVLPEGGETPIFKQFFRDWKDKDQSDGFGKVYVTEKVAHIQQIPFDASQLHNSSQMAAQHNMVDDGSGEVEVLSYPVTQCCTVGA